ncbi:DDE-type integrase/transposase/recombinase [Jidongwangia harbinensis]|uniref:DDE-type integrase/transposase/recombinase n=1 Tax=Jidongwangia harbinensis TaxID=2878561 RepID=UPI003557C4FC
MVRDVYVAFVIDVYSRRILGWRAPTGMKTALVLDALEMAIWPGRHGATDLSGLIHHHDAGSAIYVHRLHRTPRRSRRRRGGRHRRGRLRQCSGRVHIGLFKTELIN